MKRVLLSMLLVLSAAWEVRAHDINGALTWNREISRIFYARCGTCHHEGGSAFSLMAFRDGILVFSQPGALPAAALEQLIQAVRDLDMDDVRDKIAQQETAAGQ